MVERAKSRYGVSHFGGFGRNGNGDHHDGPRPGGQDDQSPSGGHTGGHGAVGVGRGADAAGPGGNGTGAAVRRAGAERRDGGGDPGAGGRARRAFGEHRHPCFDNWELIVGELNSWRYSESMSLKEIENTPAKPGILA